MSRNIHISTRKRIQQNLVAAFVCILVKSSGNTEVCEWAHRVPFCACVCMCLVPLGLWVGVLAHVFSQLTGVNEHARSNHQHCSSFPLIRVALTVTLLLLHWDALLPTWRVKSTFPRVVLGVATPG